jgi:hypothetical protein
MASKCSTCREKIEQKEKTINCYKCKEGCHTKCIDSTSSKSGEFFLNLINGGKGFRWFCENCVKIENETKNELMELKEMLKVIMNKLEKLESKQQERSGFNPSYASIAKKSTSSITIKPINKNKNDQKATKERVKQTIDPKVMNVLGLNETADSGVKITTTKENNEEIAQKLRDDLNESFEIDVPGIKYPRVKIVNFDSGNNNYRPCEIINMIKTQNRSLFQPDDEFRFIKKYTVKKNNNTKTTFIAEVNGALFARMMEAERLMIDWSSCNVYEALEVARCFKCSRFSHVVENCKSKEPTCPKCAGSHRVKDCKTELLKCINCCETNKKFNLNYDVKHSIWDKSCKSYQKRLQNKKKFIDYD